jgi:NAD(P)H-nitrite reductase large subunit
MATVRIEEIKAAGIAVDVDLLAQNGFESISEADRYRLKTRGICAQRQVGVFMLRIRVPGGKATPEQIRRVADLADAYGHRSLHVTTRAGLEIHHVRIEDVRLLWAGLAEVGLTTSGTCGDTIRNVVACAHAGTYAGEVLPPEPFVRLLHDRILEISNETNISRKINVAIACSPYCDDHVATSDIGFVATPDPDGGAPTFTLWGAGGLGATPRLAIQLRSGLAQADLLPGFDAVVALGAKYADRSARAKAKIKLLVDKLGPARVVELFNEEFALARERTAGVDRAVVFSTSMPGAQASPPRAGNVVAQKQPDRFTMPALIPMGEIATSAARMLADVSERYGDGFVHLTPDQNAEIQGVRGADVAAALDEVAALGVRTRGRGGISDVVSCVGLAYCPLAVTHSMTMGEEIALAFEELTQVERYADFRIHVSGCPHSCAKHQVADIGLAGALTEYNGEQIEAFVLYLGGNARERRLGAAYPKKIPRPLVLPIIRTLLTSYEDAALSGERFSATVARLGAEAFFTTIAQMLAGTHVPLPAIRTGRLVIIGNGMAAARFVEELHARSAESFDVTVLGDEPHGGYNRMMLTGVLGGFRAADEILTYPRSWYADRRIGLHVGTRATRIDRIAKTVACVDGSTHPYDALVIATGSRPFIPPIEGLAAPYVHVFRTLGDCRHIRAAARGARTAVVIGGGLLGLETAAGLASLGVATTVVHNAPTLMEQQLDPTAGVALRARIEGLGIAVRTGASVVHAYDDGDGDGHGVELADGERITGDIIVVCCGTIPNADIARHTGIATERGIVVDDGLQTSDPSIFAIGECAEHRGVTYGLVDPLWEQATVLADRLTRRNVLYTGSRVRTKLKVAGVNVVALGERDARPGDEVISGLDGNGRYKYAIARDGVLVGGQVVGDANAAAAFTRAFESAAPIPGSLAAFVFGERAIATESAPARSEIQRVIDAGARDIAELGRLT